jgi:hypothetical protein
MEKHGMSFLWNLESIRQQIISGPVSASLGQHRRAALAALSGAELDACLTAGLSRPQLPRPPAGKLVRRASYAAQYATLFRYLELPEKLAVYEPAAGASNSVTVAVDAHSDGGGRYATINLNRPLRDEFHAKTAHLRLQIDVIDDHAQRSGAHFAPGNFDAACFHHAINDILQTAVSEPRGMDTTTVDWWPNERRMIQWLAEDFAADGLASRGRPELMAAIAGAVELVRPGGFLIFDHWTSVTSSKQAWFPWDLFCDLVPLTRGWIAQSDLPLQEVHLPGVDPRWWMCQRVDD